MRAILLAVFLVSGCFGQAAGDSFAVASVKKSARLAGRDARGPITAGPDRLSAHNVSLKDLLLEAYRMERFQVSGPGWLDADEFDVEARAEGPVNREQLRLMLRALLTERFQMVSHTETKEIRVHALVVDRKGAKLQTEARAGQQTFHGEMREFAEFLSVQLSIPPISDPGRPSIASGPPPPVIDKTGLAGVYDLHYDFRPEIETDPYQIWQRVLQEQLGLRLERQNATADFLVVERALRVPTAN